MRLSIVCAGMFAVLSLAAPAWAETTGTEDSASSACDSSVLPGALFSKAASALSTAETLPPEDAILQENGLPALSEQAAYKAFRSACLKSSVLADAKNQSLSDHDLTVRIQRELELLLPDPIPDGNVPVNLVISSYIKSAFQFNENRKSGYLSKVLSDIVASIRKKDRTGALDSLGNYAAATDLDIPSLAAELPEGAPVAACTSGAGHAGEQAGLEVLVRYGGVAKQYAADYSFTDTEGNIKRDSIVEDQITSKYISSMFSEYKSNTIYSMWTSNKMLEFASGCEIAVKSWMEEQSGDSPDTEQMDQLAAQLFSRVIENGDVQPDGLAGVTRHFTYMQLKSILSFVNDPILYAKLEAMLMLFIDGVRLPKNTVYVPPPAFDLPLSPSET